ncbi:MAG: amidohydrolase family protein [Rhizobiales bacterium]|nr:amidohydrolase family protein [Hyphomicrobiales bacterium]
MADTADLIIRNARCLTQDDARPRAQALAIRGRRLLSVGADSDMRRLAAAHTRTIDAGGGTVLPGFIESHMHLFGGAAGLGALMVGGIEGLAALTETVRHHAEARPMIG